MYSVLTSSARSSEPELLTLVFEAVNAVKIFVYPIPQSAVRASNPVENLLHFTMESKFLRYIVSATQFGGPHLVVAFFLINTNLSLLNPNLS